MSARGFTLIELLVGISILAMVLALAAPGFADAIRNSYIRSVAESMQNGLQFARAEAVRRNAPVRFHLVNRLSAGCSSSTTSVYWIVNMGDSTNTFIAPTGSVCGSALSETTSPYFLQTSANSISNNAATSVTVSATASSLAFDGLGQLMVSTTPATTIARTTIDVQTSADTCLALGGGARCLRVVVDPGGQVRLCDPSLSTSNAASAAC